ncbi:hybrid sensor histidine kinase/response regulator [Nostoc sp.]|uniref:hybrid sensor histidine kinase/response regulator n=1 Tax=Nostoc sp. TaxID=1180 RepID=UPI002FF79F6B
MSPYIEEALRWLPESDLGLEQMSVISDTYQPNWKPDNPKFLKSTILLVDDNADMREYVKRLLSRDYVVETATDGMAALEVIADHLPDLVLTDVMMPHLDGFSLLSALRSNNRTCEIPIILLSARAGEEAKVEGLEAGADDYLIKPFSARELLARVEATLKLAQLRRNAMQQEQTLRLEAQTAKQNVDTILSSINDGFYVLDRNWRYTYVNDRLCEIIRMEREKILNLSIWDLFADTIGTEIYIQFQRAFSEQKQIQFEYLYVTWNRWYEHRVYPSPDGLTVFAADITDRKQGELEREQLLERERVAREQAEAANRIKDEFLAVLSHELRTPLNPILGWSKLLQKVKLDEARTKQALTTIERNALLQAELIEDLLDVSRILQGKLSLTSSPISLASTIRAALETVQLAAEAKFIRIESNLDAEIGLVLGDSTRLQQVIWNLLSNAVKFTPASGRVEVRLQQVDNQAQITVSDTGKGISPHFLPYVFDYFCQADGATTRKFGGLGLGLAIVRHLVELHGGTIQASSQGEGMGATFTLKFPLMPNQPIVNQDSQLSEPSLSLHGIQILVVDDDTDTRDFVAFLLEQVGARVITAASALEALEVLTQSKPNVLLSDIGLPEMDGYMLMRQIRALLPQDGGQIPAIALTSYAGEIDEKRALKVGFQRHISKPVDPDNLVKAIVNLIGMDTV